MNSNHVLGAGLFLVMGLAVYIPYKRIQAKDAGDNAIVAHAGDMDSVDRAWAERSRVKAGSPDTIEQLATGERKVTVSVAASATVSMTETKAEPSAPSTAPADSQKTCTQDDAIFGKNGCTQADVPNEPVSASSTPAESNHVEQPPSQQPSQSAPRPTRVVYESPRYESAPVRVTSNSSVSSAAAAILAGKGLTAAPSTITGMSKTYPGSIIQAGCYVLTEMVEDSLIVTQGADHMLTLAVRGAMPGCKLPDVPNLRLIAYVSLNGAQNRVVGKVKHCAAGGNDRKTIPCVGRVKDFRGADGLPGEIYDVSGWGIFFDLALSMATAPTIANLTKEAAGAKNIWNAAASQEIAATLQKSVARIGEKINKSFEGREIHIEKHYHNGKPMGPFVMVAFEEDALL